MKTSRLRSAHITMSGSRVVVVNGYRVVNSDRAGARVISHSVRWIKREQPSLASVRAALGQKAA
jgi:hypothetical protein